MITARIDAIIRKVDAVLPPVDSLSYGRHASGRIADQTQRPRHRILPSPLPAPELTVPEGQTK
ncbi:MAG: hypothetical protein M3443_11580 [Actinomycetota bacterium]|nr:hypothetical protein [Actinomycetota bacterium]